MIAFVNYVSRDTPPIDAKKYSSQHLLFHSSVNYNQPGAHVHTLTGNAGDDRFVEALTMLRDFREKLIVPLLYLDNDCVLMSPVDDLFELDFDVGVVYRYEWENDCGPQRCLGGFLFFSGQRLEVELQFLDNLIVKTKEYYAKDKTKWFYDQQAISDFVGAPSRVRLKDHYHYAMPYDPCLKTIDGANFLFLSANQWACPKSYFVPSKIYLYHYNHHLWPSATKKTPGGSVG